MKYDKEQAKKHRWRIPEKQFFLLGYFGGGIAGLFSMFLFHHQTKHLAFYVHFLLSIILDLWILTFFQISIF